MFSTRGTGLTLKTNRQNNKRIMETVCTKIHVSNVILNNFNTFSVCQYLSEKLELYIKQGENIIKIMTQRYQS